MHMANYISYKIGYIDEKQQDYQDCLEKIFISYKKYFISEKLFKAILQDKKTNYEKLKSNYSNKKNR